MSRVMLGRGTVMAEKTDSRELLDIGRVKQNKKKARPKRIGAKNIDQKWQKPRKINTEPVSTVAQKKTLEKIRSIIHLKSGMKIESQDSVEFIVEAINNAEFQSNRPPVPETKTE